MTAIKLGPEALWQSLSSTTNTEGSVIYLTLLAEDVSTQDPTEREIVARGVESKMLMVPSLEFYGRVGLYDFLGVSSVGVDSLLVGLGRAMDVRCGVASLGERGLVAAETLMIGTTEASRENRQCFAFRLFRDRVRPAKST